MTFKFRPVRGSLSESILEVKNFKNKDALFDYLNTEETKFNLAVDFLSLYDMTFKKKGYDKRIDWNVHIVLLKDIPVGYISDSIT